MRRTLDGRTLHVPGRLTDCRRAARAGDAVAMRVFGAAPRTVFLLDAGGRRVACMVAAPDRQHVLTVHLPNGLRPGLYTLAAGGARDENAAVTGLVILPQN